MNLRDTRYCEIIPSIRDGNEITSSVYNTLGYNDCPQDLWSTITVDQVNQEFGSQNADLNGPRWWVIDGITGSGDSTTGKTFTFGNPPGIEMGLRATITQSLKDSKAAQPFTPMSINRDTVWIFQSGKLVFELTDPGGKVYMMQAYTTLVDGSLTYDALAGLGSMLQLPQGWKYSTRVLDQEYNLTTETTGGVATIVQDNLKNTYQLRS